ncbi:beta-ketoacyl synthase domain-containing protein [Hypoxylon trugodes]|uniref:beta-ketoacyl synthase domain-containing protein n=1 Tax=Hypoxylon trugodes TaxID=326681 RepID=UPI00219EF197|nr:beta-ketoacyl synthase domain-containing protein [Hypoxylon trugodes]KAI1382869.1 beta-ketoacyl synthase domain-containing protein [Hypoxylon trugodes]
MKYKKPFSEPIAVVGSSCRFAGGATSPSKLWDVLCGTPDLSREVPPGRFNAKAFYHPDGEYQGTTNSVKAYWLEQDHRVFDAGLFNIAPKEAEAIDPQQRLLLEVVYEAMESAGYTLTTYSGKNVAVFAGVMTADYDTLSQRDELTASQYYATGNARSIISNRISYFYNFQGPSMTIDTACSSSLVALHQAVLSLRSGESTMACVTGVNLMITPEQFLVESSLHMLSPTGKSRMWDASADGYARGEGIAALLLKPLSRALADGDEIAAILRETGINSDGRTKGITLPNPEAQTMLIRDTYQKSGLDSLAPEDQCQYFEAHGTGTPAGDPREAEAIYNAFFGSNVSTASEIGTNHILVGSIKTVLGHTEGAAGLAGLLKVIQAMKHGSVPPNLHLNSINPNVKPFCTRLEVPTSLVAWPEPPAGQPKRASVNSFGFGGANAHVIVESYDPRIDDGIYRRSALKETSNDLQSEESSDSSFYLPLLLSAASQKSLRAVVTSYRDLLQQHPDTNLHQLAWALYSRRTALPYRLALPVHSRHQALGALEDILKKLSTSNSVGVRSNTLSARPKILGVFTGQGAQWATMSRSLFHTCEVYRNTIRTLDNVLRTSTKPPQWSLEGQIMAEGSDSSVNEAAVSQPLCTALQIGLVNLLRSLGISFHTVIGHSSGEIAAAYAADLISARDAVLISHYRGYVAHLAGSPEGHKGGMLAAGISETEATQFCRASMFEGRLHVGASNAPSGVTLSGDLDMVRIAHEELTKNKKFSRILRVDSAYHSPHMLKPATEYINALEESDIKPNLEGNETFWVSSVHGRLVNSDDQLGSGYWRDNMVNKVRFYDAVVNALSQYGPFDCALEIGPHSALKGPFTQSAKSLDHDLSYTSPLDRGKDDTLAFSNFLGFMWCQYGPQEINLRKFVEQSSESSALSTKLLDLPSYPWDHSQIHYRESRVSRKFHFKSEAPHELLGVRTRDDNDHELRWRNVLRLEKLPWVEHHSFQGQALLPASAYCIMALDAARNFLRNRPATVVELQDMQILSGINIDRESVGVEVLFAMSVLPQQKGYDSEPVVEASFTLSSCPADGTTTMRLNMMGKLSIHLGKPTSDALPPRQALQSESFRAVSESFYKMMNQTSLSYTGPFRALTSIERHFNYCSANLQRWHPEDTTTLQISPATLDCCFQSAFLAYASPGDKSLWTSFLPIRIDRMRFNLAKKKGDGLTVDARLADIRPSSPDSKATIVVDIGIFNSDGDMETQIEGLAVAALAHTLPEDDYELYLTTVTDIDPTDQIIRADITPNTLQDTDAVLIESCVRVAAFVVKSLPHDPAWPWALDAFYERLPKISPSILATINANTWSSDTVEVIDDFIGDSKYPEYLRPLRELEEPSLERVQGILEITIDMAHHHLLFRRHIGRIVKQITHRYPQMNILTLVGSGIVEDVLSAIDSSSFFTFTAGIFSERDPRERLRAVGPIEQKLLSVPLDLMGDLETQLKPGQTYDLVLLSASKLEHENASETLKDIRGIMRPGGFLVVVQSSWKVTDGRSAWANGDKHEAPTPPQWPDHLESYGFIQIAKDCDQSYFPGYSVMVRQLSSIDVELAKQPSSINTIVGDSITEHLLIIGTGTCELSSDLQRRLLPLCEKLSVRATFEETESEILKACTAVIILANLDMPIMAGMTQQMLDQLRELLRPNMKALWVTLDARSGCAEHAATFGFTRTVSAEIPSLTLQMLDLETIEGSGDTVADTFIRLTGVGRSEGNALWTEEREIHIESGRRLIPRVLPLKPLNNTVNSLRRVVPKPMNTLEATIDVVPRIAPSGLVRFEARDGRSDSNAAGVPIRVDYSSVEMLRLDSLSRWQKAYEAPTFGYVCCGQNLLTNERVVAISASNASFVKLPDDQVFDVEMSDEDGPCLVSLTMGYLVASGIMHRETRKLSPIVLIDADPTLAQCVTSFFSRYSSRPVSCYSITPTGQDSGAIYLHPRASAREIKAIFPSEGAGIFDFQSSKRAKLSKQILDLLPDNCRYYPRTEFFGICNVVGIAGEVSPGCRKAWNDGIVNAICTTKFNGNSREGIAKNSDDGVGVGSGEGIDAKHTTVSLPSLLSDTKVASSPLCLIDWRAERNVLTFTKHFMAEKIFSADKTYVLAGLTKDFGQSLCYLLVKHGARHIVLASRTPKMNPNWTRELAQAYGARVEVRKCDVTDEASVRALRTDLSESMPPIGGIANGSMVLDDRVFAQMDVNTWKRVLLPKTVGSHNLDRVFRDLDLEFFIMTSSFAAIGGHPGQSNYAAANMYMNGLAGERRRHGLVGSVLNIGVIYGLGFLQREKEELYAGLEREGYPPISERDLHHMFLEAVIAGRPAEAGQANPPVDLTTGLSRFNPTDPNPLHWHQDPRFNHFVRRDREDTGAAAANIHKSVKDCVAALTGTDDIVRVILDAFTERLQSLLRLPKEDINGGQNLSELGVDSLAAVEVRGWFFKALGKDVSVIKLLSGTSIQRLCEEMAEQIVADRSKA